MKFSLHMEKYVGLAYVLEAFWNPSISKLYFSQHIDYAWKAFHCNIVYWRNFHLGLKWLVETVFWNYVETAAYCKLGLTNRKLWRSWSERRESLLILTRRFLWYVCQYCATKMEQRVVVVSVKQNVMVNKAIYLKYILRSFK